MCGSLWKIRGKKAQEYIHFIVGRLLEGLILGINILPCLRMPQISSGVLSINHSPCVSPLS